MKKQAGSNDPAHSEEIFYPSFLFKEIVVMMLIFILVAVILALVFPVGLGDPADPTDNLFVPKPEWYFMSLYQLLKVFPGKLEIIATAIIPAGGIVLLFLLPFLDKNSWQMTGGKWVKQKADEDRLGVVWEINRIDKFATKGCAILCHNESKNDKDWYYSVNTKKEMADLWHWKSARSNPVGYTEDGFIIDNPSKEPEKGRKRDAGKGKAGKNRTKDKSGPAFMQDPSISASIPGSLLASEAVKINSASFFKERVWIPGYVLNRKWTDSFSDVKTMGAWKNGKWTVMMSRKLKTGNEDDTQFNTRKKYPFLLAAFDNAHEHNSHNSEILKLKFK